MALGHLGEQSRIVSISPPDNTTHARLASVYYEPVRDWLLSRFAWSFATTAARALVPLTNDSAEWLYCYAEPTGVLAVQRLHEVGETPGLSTHTPNIERSTKAYTRAVNASGQQAIYTNVPNALAVFTLRQADPSRYSPGFVLALTYQLAAYIAPPLLKGDIGAKTGQAMLKSAEYLLAQATTLDGANEVLPSEFLPAGIAARAA